jgi:hypothetical protein
MGREERGLKLGKRGEGLQEMNLLEILCELILRGNKKNILSGNGGIQPTPATT